MVTKRHKIERAKKIVFWGQHLSAWRSSGLGVTAYCRQHDLSLHKFKYWQYQISKAEASQEVSGSKKSEQARFVEVLQPQEKLSAPEGFSRCEIVTQHGFNIVLSHDLLPTQLHNVLVTLKAIS